MYQTGNIWFISITWYALDRFSNLNLYCHAFSQLSRKTKEVTRYICLNIGIYIYTKSLYFYSTSHLISSSSLLLYLRTVCSFLSLSFSLLRLRHVLCILYILWKYNAQILIINWDLIYSQCLFEMIFFSNNKFLLFYCMISLSLIL